jgi:hypothetical protein
VNQTSWFGRKAWRTSQFVDPSSTLTLERLPHQCLGGRSVAKKKKAKKAAKPAKKKKASKKKK